MKRIHFQDLSNKYWSAFLILSVIVFFIGLFEPIAFDNSNSYKYIMGSAYFFQALYFSRLFWFRRTVQWNKKGVVIRMNSFLGKTLRFNEIRTTELNGKVMTITMNYGRSILFDLNVVAEADVLKFNDIMLANIVADPV